MFNNLVKLTHFRTSLNLIYHTPKLAYCAVALILILNIS